MAVNSRVEKTRSKCFICGGIIMEKMVTIYDPMTGPPIFGPGGARQFKEVHGGYYCGDCGIKYEFLPANNKKIKKNEKSKKIKLLRFKKSEIGKLTPQECLQFEEARLAEEKARHMIFTLGGPVSQFQNPTYKKCGKKNCPFCKKYGLV